MCSVPCFYGRCRGHECAALGWRKQKEDFHITYGRKQIRSNHQPCTAEGNNYSSLYRNCRRLYYLFHPASGIAIAAVIVRHTVFVVCPVELCWLYSLFEKRVSENVFQARITSVEYEGSNNQWEEK